MARTRAERGFETTSVRLVCEDCFLAFRVEILVVIMQFWFKQLRCSILFSVVEGELEAKLLCTLVWVYIF